MNQDTIREVTQAVLAVAVVVGGGYMIFTQPASAATTLVGGLVGSILAYYFQRTAAQNTATKAANMAAENVKADNP